MLELATLGLLKEEPKHGYQLSRELSDSIGSFRRVSFGSLYPTLRRLERDGAVESVQGSSRGGRRKKVYRITPAGEQMFLRLLQETPHDTQSEDTRFRMRLAFFRYLPPETRVRLLQRRRVALEDRLASINGSLQAARRRGDSYTLSLIEHAQAEVRSDISWLDGLIEAENARTRSEIGRPGSRGRSQNTEEGAHQ
jgi:DNA-binding PadR family transcriptional regulator